MRYGAGRPLCSFEIYRDSALKYRLDRAVVTLLPVRLAAVVEEVHATIVEIVAGTKACRRIFHVIGRGRVSYLTDTIHPWWWQYLTMHTIRVVT